MLAAGDAQARARGSPLASHSILYLLARGVPGLLTFASILLYSRFLAPHEYGLYAIAFAGVGLANALLFLWATLAIPRLLPAYRNREASFLRTLAVTVASVAAATGAVALGIALFLRDPVARALLLFSVAILWAQVWYDLNLELARARLAPVRYGALNLARVALALVAALGLVALGFGAWGVLAGTLLGLAAPTLLRARKDWAMLPQGRFDRDIFRDALRYGLPLTLVFGLESLVRASNRFFLGWYEGPDAAGVFAVAFDLSQNAVLLVASAVALATQPLVFRTFEERGRAAADQEILRSTELLLAVALPATVGLMLLAKPVSATLLGPAYREPAAALVPGIALAAFLLCLKEYHFNLAVLLTRRTSALLWSTGAAAVVNVVLSVVLVPRFALAGALAALIATYATALVLNALVGHRLYPLPFPGRAALRVALATVGMAGALWWLRDLGGLTGLVLQAGAGALAYLSLAVALDVGGARGRARGLLRRGSAAADTPAPPRPPSGEAPP